MLYMFDCACAQKLNIDLQDGQVEREALKIQVQQYILEVRHAENLLATKVGLFHSSVAVEFSLTHL